MNKILKSYRIKKRWYYNSQGVLKYSVLPILKENNKISGTIRALKKKSNTTRNTN